MNEHDDSEFELPELEPLPDLDLIALVKRLEASEQVVSYQRSLLHGWIDRLRAELRDRGWSDGPEPVM